MKHALRALLLASMLFLHAGVINAEMDTEQNAAPLIMSIWDETRREYPNSRSIYEEIEGVELDGWIAGPAILSELGNDQRLARIDAVIAADSCDFALDFTEGPNLELPHIRPATTAGRLLLAKARLHVDAGEYDAAVEAVRGVFVLLRHLRADHSIVAARVRAEFATTAVQTAFRMPPEQWAVLNTDRLLAEIERLSERDPFGLRPALKMQSESLSDWVVRQSKTVAGCDRVWDNLDSLATMDGKDVAPSRWKLGLVVEQFGGLERSGKAFRGVGAQQAAALDHAEPGEGLRQITNRVNAGDFGPLAPYFVPNVERVVFQVLMAEQSIEILRLILQDRAIKAN